MKNFYLQIITNEGNLVEDLPHIIWPFIQEASTLVDTVEYDSIFFKPALFIIINFVIYLSGMSSSYPEMNMETDDTTVIMFSPELVVSLYEKFLIDLNFLLYPTYSSLGDIFVTFNFKFSLPQIDYGLFDFQSPVSNIDFGSPNFKSPFPKIDWGSFDFQSPVSKIDLAPFPDASLAVKLGLSGGVKWTYSALKSILNRDYLNSIVPETDLMIYAVDTRYVRINRTYESSPFRGHRIDVIFSGLLSTIYNNPTQDMVSDVFQNGLVFRIESELWERSYRLPRDIGQLLSDINNISTLVTDLGTYSLPISRSFFYSIANLSSTLNQVNQVNVTDLIENIQQEWSRNDLNGIEFVRNIRVLRALESIYKVFYPNFVSQVGIQWFETP